MQWQLDRTKGNPVDPHGVGDLLSRAENEIVANGDKLGGFRFLNSALEMMRYTREIEDELARLGGGTRLYVGFQNAAKAEAEVRRYARLQESGVVPISFGEGALSQTGQETFISWCQLNRNHELLENQWFLIAERPSPIAFVGWEVSGEENWGLGGATESDKEFAGFVSDDPLVVAELINYLEGVRANKLSADDGDRPLFELIQHTRAEKLLILVDDGKQPYYERLMNKLQRLIRSIRGTELYLYDLSAASYLVNPYPTPDQSQRRPLRAPELRSLGRTSLAEIVQNSTDSGAPTSAILPDNVAFNHLGDWCVSEGIGAVVLPVELTHPRLIDRLQGRTVEKLKSSSDVKIVIDDPDQGPRIV